MAAVHQVMGEVFHVVGRQLQPTSSSSAPTPPSQTASSATSASPTTTMSQSSTGSGPTSSPLLFFVALGFGVVFTNLW